MKKDLILLKEYTVISSNSLNLLEESASSIVRDSKNNSYSYSGILKNVPISKYTKNSNGRIYSRRLWELVKEKYQNLIEGGVALADHPPDNNPEGSVKDVCGVWHNFSVKDEGVFGDLYLIGDIGKKILDIVKAGGKIGISTVGFGKYDEQGYVDPDSYCLLRVGDVVLVPSQGTYISKDNVFHDDNFIDIQDVKTTNTINNNYMETTMRESTHILNNVIKNQIRIVKRETKNRLSGNDANLLLESKSSILDLLSSIPDEMKEERKELEELLEQIDNKIFNLKSDNSEDFKKSFNLLLEEYKGRAKTLEMKLKESIEEREKLVEALNNLLEEKQKLEEAVTQKHASILKESKDSNSEQDIYSKLSSLPLVESTEIVKKFLENLKLTKEYLPESLKSKIKDLEKVIGNSASSAPSEGMKKAINIIKNLKTLSEKLLREKPEEVILARRDIKTKIIIKESVNFQDIISSVERMFKEAKDGDEISYPSSDNSKFLTLIKKGSSLLVEFKDKTNKVLDKFVINSPKSIETYKNKIESFLKLGKDINSKSEASQMKESKSFGPEASKYLDKELLKEEVIDLGPTKDEKITLKESKKKKDKKKVLKEDVGDRPYIYLDSEKKEHPNENEDHPLRNNEVIWTKSDAQTISIDPAIEFRIRNKGVYKLADPSNIKIEKPVTSTFARLDEEKMTKEKIKLIFEEAKKEIPELEFFSHDILGSKTTVEAIKKIERYTKKLKEDPLINLNESTNRISSLKNYEDDWLSGSLF